MQRTPDSASKPSGAAPSDALDPPRQRWRLVLARAPDAPALAGRELNDTWEAALEATGLPAFRGVGRARARVAFGAPVAPSMGAERELADIVLTRSLPVWEVRDALHGHLPDGWRLLDLHDVWLGEPALAAQVAAADYRIEIDGADALTLRETAEALLAATELPRDRPKGGSMVRYDLRPLVIDVCLAEAGPPLLLRTRTRFDPSLGTGRPEEVVSALAGIAGKPLTIGPIVRERLLLATELG